MIYDIVIEVLFYVMSLMVFLRPLPRYYDVTYPPSPPSPPILPHTFC